MCGKKINLDEYEFINLSETDVSTFSDTEIAELAETTFEVLKATKGKVKKTPMNLSLIGGYLAVNGGEFIKVSPLGAKWKKGDCTKAECKVIKKAFSSAKFYFLVKNVLSSLMKKGNEWDTVAPCLAKKKA